MRKLLAILGIIGAGALGASISLEQPIKEPSRTQVALVSESIKTLPAAEKRKAKGLEIHRIASTTQPTQRIQFSGADYKIKIDHTKPIDNGVEVFARVWNPDGTQIGFGEDGTVDIERFVIINPPILVDDPNGNILRVQTATTTRKVSSSSQKTIVTPATYRRLREDPKQAILESIAHTVSIKKQKFDASKIVIGKVGNTTTTVYPDPDPESTSVDAWVRYLNAASWSTARDAATGTGVDDTAAITIVESSKDGANQYDIYRNTFLFDTSSINDTDTISSATLSLYPTGAHSNADSESVSIVASTPASNTAVTTADYDQYGTTKFSTLTIASLSTTAYNDFSLNASGLAAVDKTGVSKFGARLGTDIDNTAPTGVNRVTAYLADQTGTANDPKLVVEHAGAAPTVTPQPIIWFD